MVKLCNCQREYHAVGLDSCDKCHAELMADLIALRKVDKAVFLRVAAERESINAQ